jgi:sigma-54 dependent transcriptional regulator, acetoin dehydrogenase operon transcriptional activator AcoR
VHVKLAQLAPVRPAEVATPARAFTAGLVGSGALWLRGVHQAEQVYDSGEWLALEGEPGVGKLAVIRAVHQRRNPTAHFQVIEAEDIAKETFDEEGTLVVRHVDRLTPGRLRTLIGALQDLQDRSGAWVAVTLSQRADVADLLKLFPSTVELPPLRHHVEDVHELVPFFLGKLSPDGRLICSPEAMQVLVRASWPGNIEQLWQVLKRTVQYRRAGSIRPSDLPPETRTVSRRLLSPLESMERDAIVESLLDNDGNKVKAAESLGLSRATIYRKIHDYGIRP